MVAITIHTLGAGVSPTTDVGTGQSGMEESSTRHCFESMQPVRYVDHRTLRGRTNAGKMNRFCAIPATESNGDSTTSNVSGLWSERSTDRITNAISASTLPSKPYARTMPHIPLLSTQTSSYSGSSIGATGATCAGETMYHCTQIMSYHYQGAAGASHPISVQPVSIATLQKAASRGVNLCRKG